MSKEKRAEAKKNPKFNYVVLGECWDKHSGNDGGFTLNWSAKDVGVGQIAFYKQGSKIICDSETLSKEFVMKVFESFLEKTIIKDYGRWNNEQLQK